MSAIEPETTTTIYRARRVITMNPANPSGSAVAVRGDRILGDGSVEELAGWAAARLGPGDALEIRTPGGGGWGSVDDAC